MNKHGVKVCVFTSALAFVMGFMTYHICLLIEEKQVDKFAERHEQFDDEDLDEAFEDEEDSAFEGVGN